MRFLGLLLFLACGAASAYAVYASFHARRPRDLLFAALAPIALVLALLGLLLVFVPGFLSD